MASGQLESGTAHADEARWEWQRSLLVDYAIVATILFVVMTILAMHAPYFAIDLQISHALQSLRNPALDRFMELVGFPGLYPQVIALNTFIIVILYVLRLKWESLTLLVLGPIIGISGTLLRYTIDRPRPSPDLVWVAQEIEKGRYSFPSGHALGFMAIFGFLWFLAFTLLRPSWHRTVILVLYGLLIALVGFSRVYVGEHWASDVLAGYIVGSAYLAVTILFYKWGKRAFFKRIESHLP